MFIPLVSFSNNPAFLRGVLYVQVQSYVGTELCRPFRCIKICFCIIYCACAGQQHSRNKLVQNLLRFWANQVNLGHSSVLKPKLQKRMQTLYQQARQLKNAFLLQYKEKLLDIEQSYCMHLDLEDNKPHTHIYIYIYIYIFIILFRTYVMVNNGLMHIAPSNHVSQRLS